MRRRELLGVGAAACVACCTVPLLVAVGAVTSLGLAATLVVGAGALLATLAVVAGLLAVHRRRAAPATADRVAVERGPTNQTE